MSPIEQLMRAHLTSRDPEKVRHARGRIALGFANTSPAKVPFSSPPSPAPVPSRRFRRSAEEIAAMIAADSVHCLYRSPSAATNNCNPWRCYARFGPTCGGSHTHDAHCRRCLYPETP